MHTYLHTSKSRPPSPGRSSSLSRDKGPSPAACRCRRAALSKWRSAECARVLMHAYAKAMVGPLPILYYAMLWMLCIHARMFILHWSYVHSLLHYRNAWHGNCFLIQSFLEHTYIRTVTCIHTYMHSYAYAYTYALIYAHQSYLNNYVVFFCLY